MQKILFSGYISAVSFCTLDSDVIYCIRWSNCENELHFIMSVTNYVICKWKHLRLFYSWRLLLFRRGMPAAVSQWLFSKQLSGQPRMHPGQW